MNSQQTQNRLSQQQPQSSYQLSSPAFTQHDYTLSMQGFALDNSLQEDYFCQGSDDQTKPEIISNKFFLSQKQEPLELSMTDLTTNLNQLEACNPGLGREQEQQKDKSPDQKYNNNVAVLQDQVEEEASMRTYSDGNESAQQQPPTDEETKDNSEEDSPQLDVKSKAKNNEEIKDPKQQSQEYENLITQAQSKTGKVSKDDFSLIQVIGTGSYGKVLLVKKKDSGKLYAMKMLKKKQLRKQKQVRNTWTERKILEKISHPFIVRMNFAFQSEKKLFFVLDYCPGGELFFYISQIGRFKEQSAKFYAANILLALECLHENGIVYRDLKPENILIDRDGYAKLTDFGLSKDNLMGDALANSFCGTAEYLAPEVINKKGYTKACDWWSFGCVIYEMLTAIPPFYSKKRQEIYDKIKFKNPNFYNFHSEQAVDLLTKLLEKDPLHRLGFKQGASEIKQHPFFSDVNWDMMLAKRIATPYKPLLDSKDDTKHFDQSICNIPVDSPPENSANHASGSFADGLNDEFDGFSFVAQTLLSNNNESEYLLYDQQQLQQQQQQ